MRSLADVLGEVSASRGWERRFAPYRVFAIWDGVVGKEFAEVARPIEIHGRDLMVGVIDQVWLNQLSFMKEDLLRRINRVMGDDGFSGLRFVVNADFSVAPDPGLPRPEKVRPSQPDKKSLQRLDNLIISIDDDRVREVMRKVWLRING